MNKSITQLSTSPYIKNIIENTISKIFKDSQTLYELTQEIEKDLEDINLDKGYLSEKEKEILKISTGDLLGKISKKIIDTTYETFISAHKDNVFTVITKTNPHFLFDIFLHNIYNRVEGIRSHETLQLYKAIKSEVEQSLSLTRLINPNYKDTQQTEIISKLEMILLEDEKTVCYKITKLSEVTLEQEILKKVLMDDNISTLLAQFFTSLNDSSLPAREQQEELLPMQKAYIQNLYEGMYKSKLLYGERDFGKLVEFSDLHYLNYYEYKPTEQLEKKLSYPSSADLKLITNEEIFEELYKKKFNPDIQLNFILSNLSN